MLEFLNFLFSIFWQFFEFLDSFYLIGELSVLRLLIITLLFTIAFKFLLPHNKGGN